MLEDIIYFCDGLVCIVVDRTVLGFYKAFCFEYSNFTNSCQFPIDKFHGYL